MLSDNGGVIESGLIQDGWVGDIACSVDEVLDFSNNIIEVRGSKPGSSHPS